MASSSSSSMQSEGHHVGFFSSAMRALACTKQQLHVADAHLVLEACLFGTYDYEHALHDLLAKVGSNALSWHVVATCMYQLGDPRRRWPCQDILAHVAGLVDESCMFSVREPPAFLVCSGKALAYGDVFEFANGQLGMVVPNPSEADEWKTTVWFVNTHTTQIVDPSTCTMKKPDATARIEFKIESLLRLSIARECEEACVLVGRLLLQDMWFPSDRVVARVRAAFGTDPYFAHACGTFFCAGNPALAVTLGGNNKEWLAVKRMLMGGESVVEDENDDDGTSSAEEEHPLFALRFDSLEEAAKVLDATYPDEASLLRIGNESFVCGNHPKMKKRRAARRKRTREDDEDVDCGREVVLGSITEDGVKRWKIRRHVEEHAAGCAGAKRTQKAFTCTYEGCGKAFTRKDNLIRHVNEAHRV